MNTDEKLIRKIKKRYDRAAADELVRRHYREIYAFVYRQTGTRELAEDLTQEIFIAALRGISSYHPRKAAFRTWLYRIAANKVTDHYRSRAHRARVLETEFVSDEVEKRDGDDEPVLSAITSEETVTEIMELVAQFGEENARIFQMKVFTEMTFREIADETGVSENTVKTRYYKIIGQIRKRMTDK